MPEQLDHCLNAWVAEQRAAGISPEESMSTLVASGFHRFSAREAVLPLSGSRAPLDAGGSRGSLASSRDLGDRTVRVMLSCRRPDLTVVRDFVDEAEAGSLIHASVARLLPSQVVDVDAKDGAGHVSRARTSHSMYFAASESAEVRALEARAALLAGRDACCAEPVQVVRYTPGTGVENHQDYFDVRDPSSAAHLGRRGQRVATVLVYLNTPQAGGETVFADPQLEIIANLGTAVHFAFPTASEQDLALHSGAPVMLGEKWIATIWFRDQPQSMTPMEPIA